MRFEVSLSPDGYMKSYLTRSSTVNIAHARTLVDFHVIIAAVAKDSTCGQIEIGTVERTVTMTVVYDSHALTKAAQHHLQGKTICSSTSEASTTNGSLRFPLYPDYQLGLFMHARLSSQ